MNQVLRLQEDKKLLKQSSEEEVGQLWTQLESMRASRQELGGEIFFFFPHLLDLDVQLRHHNVIDYDTGGKKLTNSNETSTDCVYFHFLHS